MSGRERVNPYNNKIMDTKYYLYSYVLELEWSSE